MASQQQIQANRNNAKKSTGPHIEEGKSRASQNALKHGLLARDAVLPDEDPAEFEAQLAALEDALQHEDALEHELVRQMADAQWRLRRLTRIESGYFAACLVKSRRHAKDFQPHFLRPGHEGETLLLGYSILGETQELTHLARYDAHLGRRFERSLQQLVRLRGAREKHQASEAKQAVHRPGGQSNRANPRPSNGTSPNPAHIPESQPSSSETNCQTKPISPNPQDISELASGASGQSHPNPAIPEQVSTAPPPETNPDTRFIAASRVPNNPQGAIPDRI